MYPANAGFLTDLDAEKPLSEKRFFLANLLPTRAGEKTHYERVLAKAGFRVDCIDLRYRMEGEADFFPAGDLYLLTYGRIERQRFVPAFDWPPWKRVYGFRTDAAVRKVLQEIVPDREILTIELLLEAYYHGDTTLCAFGPGRQHLLVYPQALQPDGWDRLREIFGERVLELEEHDALRYAANSFALTQASDSLLVMPAGLSTHLLDQVRERGVTPVPVDVSEFLKKGGGSVKCMIGDLGSVEDGVSLGSLEFSGTSEREEKACSGTEDPGAV